MAVPSIGVCNFSLFISFKIFLVYFLEIKMFVDNYSFFSVHQLLFYYVRYEELDIRFVSLYIIYSINLYKNEVEIVA